MVAPAASNSSRPRPRSDSETSGTAKIGAGAAFGDEFGAVLSSLLGASSSSPSSQAAGGWSKGRDTVWGGGQHGQRRQRQQRRQKERRDPHAVKLAALTSALIETARERRGSEDVGGDAMDENGAGGAGGRSVGAAELFVAALGALSGSLLSRSADGDGEDRGDKSDLFYPLLEVLRLTVPHTASSHPTLYASQFPALARSLRGAAAFAEEEAAANKDGRDEAGSNTAVGSNALMRRTCRASSAALVSLLIAAESAGGVVVDAKLEKDALGLFRAGILHPFDDTRAKVRREAHGAASEVIVRASIVPSSSSSSGKLGSALQDHVASYAHSVITAKSKNDDGDEPARNARMMHLLAFLEGSGPGLGPAARAALGEGLVGLALGSMECAATADPRSSKGRRRPDGGPVLMCSAALAALVAIIESDSGEDEGTDEESEAKGSSSSSAALGEFVSRVLASLLQHAGHVGGMPIPPGGGSRGGRADAIAEVRVLYARCCASCCVRMIRPSPSSEGGGKGGMKGMRGAGGPFEVGTKLLPLTLAAVLGLCDASRLVVSAASAGGGGGGGGGEAERAIASGIAAELSRTVRTCLPEVMVRLSEENDEKERGDAMKCVRGCVGAAAGAVSTRYCRGWDAVLPFLATTVATVGANLPLDRWSAVDGLEAAGAGDAVRALVRLHAEAGDTPAAREVVAAATGSVVDGLGVEVFLGLTGLDGDPGDEELGGEGRPDGMRDDRAWMLRVLPRSAVHATHSSSSGGRRRRTRLSFFRERILGLARKSDVAAARAVKGGRTKAAEAAVLRERVAELWGLLPYFCANPEDLRESLPGLTAIFVKAMGDSRYPQLLTIICNSLRVLSAGVRERADEPSFENDVRDAKDDLNVMSEASAKLLPTLFRIVETLHGAESSNKKKKEEGEDDGMDIEEDAGAKREQKAAAEEAAHRVPAVTAAVGELARVCPKPFLSNLFRKVVQRLLAATAESDEAHNGDALEDRICSLLGLAQALVSSGSLEDESVSLLYRSVRPLMRCDGHDSRVQKRVYRVMAEICERHGDFVTAPERLEEMAELMVGSVATCHISSRHMRLKCMTHVVQGLNQSNPRHMVVIANICAEVLLCLKDSNAKTREAAYQLLLAMAKVCGDMPEFFKIVAAALGAKTPHMRSAAVMAMSRLVFEFARTDDSVQELLPSALSTVVVLFDETSREVTKAAVGFVRVSVAAMEPARLEPLLPDVVGGLMKYGRGKGRFRAKIKIVLKRLARTFGFDKIATLVPESDSRLVTHMRKLAERAERRRVAGRADGGDAGGTVFDNMMESDEEDSDDGRTFLTGVTGFTRMTATSGKSLRSAAVEKAKSVAARSMARTIASAKTSATSASAPRIRAEKAGEVLDMLDPTMAKSVHFADEAEDDEFSDDDGRAMKFDDLGRLVIGDDDDAGNDNADEVRDGDDEGENDEIRGGKRQRISKFESAKTAAGEARAKKVKKKKDEPRALGGAYKSKKAGGDVKKKGQKYEPYAYVPLDGKRYSKKNRSKAVAEMSTVVRSKAGKRKRR